MKMILCDPTDKFFSFDIVEAEPLKKMWRITDGGKSYRKVGSRVSQSKIMPYTDELWEELISIQQAKQEVWTRRLALREFLVGGKQ